MGSTIDDYDFWIIELEWSTEKYGDYVVELDSPTDDLDLDDGDSHELAVIGFGDLFSGSPFFTSVNQEVVVDYVPNDVCEESYPGLITTSMLCASSPGKDSCQVRKYEKRVDICLDGLRLSPSSTDVLADAVCAALQSRRATRAVPSSIRSPRSKWASYLGETDAPSPISLVVRFIVEFHQSFCLFVFLFAHPRENRLSSLP